MKRRTEITAEDGKQEIVITREFDLPLELLFRAYVEPDIVEQWMGTKVLKLENRKHGGYQYETVDAEGKVVFRANGVIHEFSPNRNITRTFQMENALFAAQLEFLDFEKLTEDTSKLTMHIVFRSVACRDDLLRLPFAQGINMAHNRLQQIVSQLH
jgi:uncharacterized protein YndB with AHSA1/START domain